MGRLYDEIDGPLRDWIERQAMFFVGTAPLDRDGHVNVSPKGPIDTLAVLGPREIAFVDMIGSGAETIAHLRENERIVIMLCAFQGPPRVLRLHGSASVVMAGEAGFDQLVGRFAAVGRAEARRAVVRVDVRRIADSCGYGVPLMRFEGLRPHAELWAEKKLRVGGLAALVAYQREKNAVSIDGLPAVEV